MINADSRHPDIALLEQRISSIFLLKPLETRLFRRRSVCNRGTVGANHAFIMLGASFLPARFRNDHPQGAPSTPGYLNRQITPILQSVSRKSFTHPIRTIAFVALLASTSYVGLLEGSLFEDARVAGNAAGDKDLSSLVESGRRLKLGEETGWKWQIHGAGLDETEKVRSLGWKTLATKH